MNTPLCRSRWILPLIAAVLFLAAELALLPARAQKTNADATAPSSVFNKLFMDEALVDYTGNYLGKQGNIYYIEGEQASYQLACSDRNAVLALNIISATVNGQEFFLQEIIRGSEYGFDFGIQTGSFDIEINHLSPSGEIAAETLSVCAMREYPSENLRGSVWYSAAGWTMEEDTFRAGQGAGTLTILSKHAEALGAAVRAADGDISVTLDGVLQPSAASFTLPAAEDTPHTATFTYTGNGNATVALGEPGISLGVKFTLDYDAALGDVYNVYGAAPELLAPREYILDEGAALSLLFVPKASVASSLMPEVNVPCRLLDYTINGKTHAGASFETILTENTAVSVRFAETLPDLPTDVAVTTETYGGESAKRSFCDGETVPLPAGSDVTLAIAMPAEGISCTAELNGNRYTPESVNGVFIFSLLAPETQSRVDIFFEKEGFAPEEFTVILQPHTKIALTEDSVTECIYDENGAILQAFSLYAAVHFTDGTQERIPLTYTVHPTACVYESSVSNAEYAFAATITLYIFRPEFAKYCAEEAVLQNAENIPAAATALYENYLSLLENRTAEEQNYIKERLPAAFAAEIVTAVTAKEISEGAASAAAMLQFADGSMQETTLLLSSENFTTENGKPIATGLYANSFRDTVYYIIWKADVTATPPEHPEEPEEKPQVTIQISDSSSVYGEKEAPLTYTAIGLPAGASLTVILEKEAGSAVGTYAITGSCSDDRFEISITEGVYTITPRPVTIRIDDVSALFGDRQPDFTYSVTQGSLLDDLGIELSAETADTAGTYAITGRATSPEAKNYSITWINGSYTISARKVSLSANDITLSPYATWQDVAAALQFSVTEGELSEEHPLGVELSVIIDGQTLTEDNFSSLWKGGTHTVHITAGGNGYTVSATDGTLFVPPAAIGIANVRTEYIYSGSAVQPFDWKTNLTGLLPSAAADCFAVELLDETGKPVPSILNAGAYLLRVRIAHSDEYAFISGAQTQFYINMTKFDISNYIEIIGVKDSETLIFGDDFQIYVQISEYNVQFDCILEYDNISIDFEMIDSDDLVQSGVYSVRVVVSDENYCGEASVSFTLAEGFSEETDRLENLLQQFAAAEQAAQFGLLLQMREVLLSLSEQELAQAMDNERFAAAYAQCAEAWNAFENSAEDELADTMQSANVSAPALLVRTAMILAVGVAVAAVCKKFH